MKFTVLILLVLALCWGCISDREPVLRPNVTVELTVRPDPMMTATRSTDETTIRDLNFYLMDKAGRVVVYRYLTTTTLRFECLPGNYLIRIAANVGRSLGETADLSQYKVIYQQDYDILPMFCEQETTISLSSGNVVQLPPICVKRIVAKISCNLTAKPADIELKSVQVMSVPRAAMLSSADAPASVNPDDYTDGPETTLTGQQAAGSYYMLPNPQGINTSITDQKQKNADNAPACASWLLIRATRGSKVLAYSVYLGENNTSDFNVHANCHYTLNITILNDNTVDTRIAAYTATVYDDFGNKKLGGYCVYDPDYCLHVDMVNDNSDLTITGRLELIKGNSTYLEFDRKDAGPTHGFEIYNPKGGNYFYVNYCPPLFTIDNSTLAYRVTLTDEYGFSRQYDFSHEMANVIYVHVGAGGIVTADKSLYSAAGNEGDGKQITALCYENGCRFTAVPDEHYAFEGWYSDAAHTKKLSSAVTYTQRPKAIFTDLYARFRAVDSPLDSKGTANCYIATALNKRYSFDATVQGNGATTLNISPKRLYGTNAKVIWETGTRRGAVISSAEYTDGRIYLVTGPERGNAVIGLFDAAGNCVWSWHIWSVDYDPVLYQQTYSSGAVFMDRNMGALTTDYTNVAARGLYYQWGRKDPFIYPGNCTTYTGIADITYMDGYAYSDIYPNDNNAKSVMTIDWSVQHPTTLMHNLVHQNDKSPLDIMNWLYTAHHNLWGNYTTSSAISSENHKTIYDPCPVGWRVAALEDYKNIQPLSITTPYYARIYYRSTLFANFPLGGHFNGSGFLNNGTTGFCYTNAPYSWNGSAKMFDGLVCGAIIFRTDISAMNYYRSEALPVRCVKE